MPRGLFALGDRPEAPAWLAEQGYDSTLTYIGAMAIRVLEEETIFRMAGPSVSAPRHMKRGSCDAPSGRSRPKALALGSCPGDHLCTPARTARRSPVDN